MMVKKIDNIRDIVTDKKLNKVWAYANFGSVTKREIVRYSLLKAACDYHQGFTSIQIIIELGLATAKGGLTKKGKKYLWFAFKDDTKI